MGLETDAWPPPALLLTTLWLGVNVISPSRRGRRSGDDYPARSGPERARALDAVWTKVGGRFSLFAFPPIYEELPDFRRPCRKAHKAANISAARFAAMRELLHVSHNELIRLRDLGFHWLIPAGVELLAETEPQLLTNQCHPAALLPLYNKVCPSLFPEIEKDHQ